MIEYIRMQNFQSHKDTTIVFEKGVNVIVGQSDSGKSAVIRALLLVMKNKPSGDAYRSHWGGDTSVEIKVNGHIVKRVRTNSKNMYVLDDKVFEAFGNDVPVEIQKVLNINDTNIQGQLDAPFLLSESPGAVAAHFNKVANLEKIDSAMSFVQQLFNKNNTTLQHLMTNLKNYTEELEKLPNTTKLEKGLFKIDKLVEKGKAFQKESANLTGLILAIEDVLLNKEKYEQTVRKEKIVDDLLKVTLQKKVYVLQIKNLESLWTDIAGGREEATLLENEIQNKEPILEKLTKVCEELKKTKEQKEKLRKDSTTYYDNLQAQKSYEKTIKKEFVINNMLLCTESLKITRDSYNNLNKLYTNIQTRKTLYETALKNVKELEENYQKNFPDVCPLCADIIKF